MVGSMIASIDENGVDQGNRTLNVLNNLKNTDGGIGLLNVANAGFYGYDVQQDGLAGANGMSSNGGAFDAHVRVGTVDTEQTWTESYLSQFNAGGNVRIGSDKDVNLLGGTQINAGKDIILNAGRDLNIAANEDTYKYRDSSTGVTVGYNGSWYVGADHSRSKSDSTTYTNANLQAGGNILTSSGRDTNIAGANLLAGKVLDVNVGRDLYVATLQNSTQSSSYGGSFTAGYGQGSVSASASESDRKFSDNQTTLIGQQGVRVNVAGHTQIDGGLIANIDTNGVDQGNLQLTTKTLGYTDLADNDDFRSIQSLTPTATPNPLPANTPAAAL
jgi:filamentous hemagglutinin